MLVKNPKFYHGLSSLTLALAIAGLIVYFLFPSSNASTNNVIKYVSGVMLPITMFLEYCAHKVKLN